MREGEGCACGVRFTCCPIPAPACIPARVQILEAGTEKAKYMINLKQVAKYVVALGEKVAPTDIEEAMRVGVDRTKYSIQVRRHHDEDHDDEDGMWLVT